MNSRTLRAELAARQSGWGRVRAIFWPWSVIGRQTDQLEMLDLDRNHLARALANAVEQERRAKAAVRDLDRQLGEAKARIIFLEHTLNFKVHFRNPETGRLLKRGVIPPGIGV